MMDMQAILEQLDGFFAENRHAEAEDFLMECIGQAAALGDSGALLSLLNELIGLCRETGQAEKSVLYGEKAMALAASPAFAGEIAQATTALNVGNALRAAGRLEDSLAHYALAGEIYAARLNEWDFAFAELNNNLSLLHQERGDFAAAADCLRRALEIARLHRGREFEQAVSHANLAGCLIELGELAEAEENARAALEKFDRLGVKDTHFAAALAARGRIQREKHDYFGAADSFRGAMEAIEGNFGRTEYYYRVKEFYDEVTPLCDAEGEDVRNISGLELCRRYYASVGAPMLAEAFPDDVDKIAVGMAGEGSDCFGFDDALSRDHDWGPGFALWVSDQVYDRIGPALQEAYDRLPKTFLGYTRAVTAQGADRVGVCRIRDFFARLADHPAAAVNGAVFRDDEGAFSSIRSYLNRGYERPQLLRRIAQAVTLFGQGAQYNYPRMMARGERGGALLALAEGIRQALIAAHLLAGKYPPHDKWLFRSAENLPGFAGFSTLCEEAISGGEKCDSLVEQIAGKLLSEMKKQGISTGEDLYLPSHASQLLLLAENEEKSHENLVDELVRAEFAAFDRVKNEGGRADCQDNWETFSLMRGSQYAVWTKPMLVRALTDFRLAEEAGRNLLTEKYARMMKSTAPARYAEFSASLPEIAPEKRAIIEEIVRISVGWMEEFAAEYPHMAGNARSIHTAEDSAFNTSAETYLRGELETYSDGMLVLYGRFLAEIARRGGNLTAMIMEETARRYGYADLDDAERKLCAMEK